ncbi:metal ABC transporter solute-binding protein, Zn/Mn family [Myxococcota bacterium]
MTRLLISLIVVLSLATTACVRKKTADSRPVVVVSVVPLAYFVNRLAQDSVRVEVLIPPGGNPHSHEPGMVQARTIADASLFIKVGHPNLTFEKEWVDRMLATHATLKVVDGFAGVKRQDEDPHVWGSPQAVRILLGHLDRALGELLPAQREEVASRAKEVLRDVEAVDRELKRSLSGLASRRFVVFHPAWGYLARDYGLEQVDIEQQARDPRRLSEAVRRARAEGVRLVLIQPQTSRQSAELVARDMGARVESLDPLAQDWVANMRLTGETLRRALAP